MIATDALYSAATRLGYHYRPMTVAAPEESVVPALADEPIDTPRPFFSVVIPTYRRLALLPDALRSVAAQTIDDFEVLVVDDDPEMSAKSIVESFDALPIRYLPNDNARGGSGARNTGAFAATGQWVAFLDDDDSWLPHKLEAVKALINGAADPDLALVYSGHEKYDYEKSSVISTFTPQVRGRVLKELLYKNYVGGMSVAVVRRELLVRLEGLDARFLALQDMELYVRLAANGSVDFVPEPLVRIRSSARERITLDPQKKLQGAHLFAEKYHDLIVKDPRLHHRAASRVLTFAVAARRYDLAASALFWTLAGLVVDPANVTYVARAVARQLFAGPPRGARLRPSER